MKVITGKRKTTKKGAMAGFKAPTQSFSPIKLAAKEPIAMSPSKAKLIEKEMAKQFSPTKSATKPKSAKKRQDMPEEK